MDRFTRHCWWSIMANYVDNYIKEMIKQEGTDIHLPSGCCPMIRVYGKLKKTDLLLKRSGHPE